MSSFFSYILEFLYLGSVNIQPGDVEEFQRVAEQLQIYQISSILEEGKYDENKELNGSAIVESLHSAFLKLPKTVIVEEKEKKENNDDDLSSILLKLPKKNNYQTTN